MKILMKIENSKTIFYKYLFAISLHFLLGFSAIAQLPKSEIWMADFKNIHTQPVLFSISLLSDFNPDGYNNQPQFWNYNELYISAAIDTSTKTDIYALNIQNKTFRQVTNTPSVSEFSPTFHPNGKDFSCVRIEEDGVDQSLWLYPENRSNIGSRLLNSLQNVGYHTWIDPSNVALFLVNQPHKLALANTSTGEVQILIDDIGRCLKTSINQELFFVHKLAANQWVLKKYDLNQKVISSIIKMPFETEDFEILSNGSFITARGTRMLIFDPKKDKDWRVLYDFELLGLTNIQRPIVFRDRIVFVNNKK